MLLRLDLSLWQWGRKVSSLLLVLKACSLVRPIAKGLACRMAATAKHDHLAAPKTVRFAFHVDEFDYSFDAQRAIIADCDFRQWQLCLQMPSSLRGKGRDALKKYSMHFYVNTLASSGRLHRPRPRRHLSGSTVS